jgi:hypothetical protein
LCAICLVDNLGAATVKLGKDNSPSVERLFSVAGQVVTAKRNRLHPSSVTLLVFLHEAIPGVIEREGGAGHHSGQDPFRTRSVLNK